MAEKANLTDQAISYYTDYIRKGGEEVKIADYFSLGQTYYIAASAFLPQDNTPLSEADSLKMMPYALAADSLFGYVAERVPDSYMGNFWRAVQFGDRPPVDRRSGQTLLREGDRADRSREKSQAAFGGLPLYGVLLLLAGRQGQFVKYAD